MISITIAASLAACSSSGGGGKDIDAEVHILLPDPGAKDPGHVEDLATAGEDLALDLPVPDDDDDESRDGEPAPVEPELDIPDPNTDTVVDIPVQPDVPDVADVLPPDIPCGGCPASTPDCVNGKCTCNATSCGPGAWCDEGACSPCGDEQHCGPQCLKCGGSAPKCVEGKCGCLGVEDCPQGKWCNEVHQCSSCFDEKHCGPECVPCEAPTPFCAAGEKCVGCFTGADCGAGTWCDGTTCVPCTDSDPLHCGPQCLACGAYNECAGGTCLPCDKPEKCGPTCQPCTLEKPFCAPDPHDCVQCLDSSACPQATHCDKGACVPDCQVEGCATDNAPDGFLCSKAKVIGRKAAAAGYKTKGDTSDSDDNDNTSCWDAQSDNYFRIYLVAGEVLDVTMDPVDWDFDASLKLYKGTKCKKGGDNPIVCEDGQSDGQAEKISGFVAPSDGWYTIVCDGEMAFYDDYDYGPYDLSVSLKCKQPDCCCP